MVKLFVIGAMAIMVVPAANAASAARGVKATHGANTAVRTASAAPDSSAVAAADAARTNVLGVGDVVKVTVFQNPDMTTEARIADDGTISFPLLGDVRIAGLTSAQAEKRIADGLKKGGFVVQPQVNLFLTQLRSRVVPVLGQVSKPGKYALEEPATKLTDLIALAGGSTGADTVTIMKKNGDGYEKVQVDLPELFLKGDLSNDLRVSNGDIVYVPRAPVFYVYGEVARPGVYRLERNMTLVQALATAGGLTPRASNKDIGVTRRDDSERIQHLKIHMDDLVRDDDVIYVSQSWF